MLDKRNLRMICTVWIAMFVLLIPAAGRTDDTAGASATARYPGETWEHVSPETMGWSPEGLDAAIALARELGTDALMVVFDGVVIAEYGDVTRKVNVRSIRKSLLSALLGIQIEQKRLALDATLADLGIDEKVALSDAERTANVADLMTSRSGVYAKAAWEHPSHAASRPKRGAHAPGTHFYYNNWDFNALGTIYERAADGDLFADFLTEIALPLGMQDYGVEDGEYLYEDVSEHPAYIFRMNARDLARFGLLYLRDGRWTDKQIVSGAWVQESTRTHVQEANPHSGYGRLWRTYPKYGTHYAATGAGSQMVVVSPDARVVVVHLKETAPGQPGVPRNRFWQIYGTIMAAAPK